MDNSAPAIAKLLSEFTRHQTLAPGTRFQPSLEASTAVSNVTRDLDIKRQLDDLTAAEEAAFEEIAALWEGIARFNNRVPIRAAPASGENEQIYSLRDSKFVEQKPEPRPEIPVITYELADQIITGLNKQFEKNIMSNRNFIESAAVASEQGRNLQDYLSHIQTQAPRLPFADEESHIDLSKLRSAS